ncbi:MAG: hypothetical protein Q7W05_12990 [Deltaproteobacteria bacterium]|jgi:hypothetical protein|nr:hypothetical protein [Deltaproteobacteria bacterium]
MIDEDLFANAVKIAAAFVANGDIRCNDIHRKDSNAMLQLQNIIPAIYSALQSARLQIEEPLGTE